MSRHPLERTCLHRAGFSAKVFSRLLAVLLLSAGLGGCQGSRATDLDLHWEEVPDRPWPGPDLWANRLQDWEVRDGKLRALSSLPMRTAHILTRRGAPNDGEILVTLRMGLSSTSEGSREGQESEVLAAAGGFLVGAGGADLDYRRAALIHHSPGPGGGLFLGVDEHGYLLVLDFSDENRMLARSEGALPATDSLELRIRVSDGKGARDSSSGDGEFSLALEARTLEGHDAPLTLDLQGIAGHRLAGGMALASHGTGEDGPRAWFSTAEVAGAGVEAHPDRGLGPILGTQYTISRSVLTLTAQLFPIRMEDWNASNSASFRLTLQGAEEGNGGSPYVGTVRADPGNGEEFVVAAFTGNHNVASPGVDRGSFDWERNLWFPHDDILEHIKAHAPDFLFFSGDQVYEGASPTRADFQNPYGDYLYKWYLWLWAFRDLTRETPAVTIPDDHDVFHGNVWGAGGIATPPGLTGSEAQDAGGYRLPPDWVNMVQRTQTSHLPNPWDATPSDQGIEVYFTDILYGGVSFAVLEDRKFKSAPKGLLPDAEIRNGWAQNPDFDARAEADSPGASLLGRSQEVFLEEWAADWTGGTWMKVVLSQTIFGNVATIPADAMSGSVIPSLPIAEPGAYVTGDKTAADMDSNGWPPSGRVRALRSMRKGFAVHLAGDQHLASTIQYGVDEYGDGPFALCVPSVANFWPRRWFPPEPSRTRDPDAPAYTGEFQDGFGNLMTVFAVSNPAQWGREPTILHNRAPGYGIARFDRSTREVSLEAWPRWSDPETGGSPYPGWPVRFQQEQGYGAPPQGYLPTLVVEGITDPVVQVISEPGGTIVYTIRMRGTRFTPKVFGPGTYTVRVGEPGTDAMQTFQGLQAGPDTGRSLQVRFDGKPS